MGLLEWFRRKRKRQEELPSTEEGEPFKIVEETEKEIKEKPKKRSQRGKKKTVNKRR